MFKSVEDLTVTLIIILFKAIIREKLFNVQTLKNYKQNKCDRFKRRLPRFVKSQIEKTMQRIEEHMMPKRLHELGYKIPEWTEWDNEQATPKMDEPGYERSSSHSGHWLVAVKIRLFWKQIVEEAKGSRPTQCLLMIMMMLPCYYFFVDNRIKNSKEASSNK